MNTDEIKQKGFFLGEKLAETEYTVTYAAVQESLNRTVQLRFLKPMFEAHEETLAYFLGVARLLARIKCESIISVFDIISNSDCRCIVMENVSGPSLAKVIHSHGVFPRKQALGTAVSIAEGISLLWSQLHLVLHNLSASTIHIRQRGGVKITDFFRAEQADAGDEQATFADMRALGELLRIMISDKRHPLDSDVREVLEKIESENISIHYPSWDSLLNDLRKLLTTNTTQFANNTRLRVSRPSAANSLLQTYQGKTILNEHKKQISREIIRKEVSLWFILLAWFALLFWVRAYSPWKEVEQMIVPLQEAGSEVKGVITAKIVSPLQEKDETEAAPVPSKQLAVVPPSPSNAEAPKKTKPTPMRKDFLPPQVSHALAVALSGSGLAEAKKIINESDISPALRTKLLRLLTGVPAANDLIRKKLLIQVGRQISFSFGGKTRNAILRSINPESLSVEIQGRGVDIPFSKLPADQLLHWIPPPRTPEETLSWCILALRSSRKSEIVSYAAQCPLLKDALLEVAFAEKKDAHAATN